MRGLIIDWGGVLTIPLRDAIGSWLRADGIDGDHYREIMRAWVTQAYAPRDGTVNPVHGLERGDLPGAEFERIFAARLRTLDGRPVPAAGLLRRMFGAFRPVLPMYEALRRVRAAGVRTCLLSNSWGNDYPRELWVDAFDAVVISAEVGMRKPEEQIFRHALERIGLAPEECVFVDDIEHNVRVAEQVGMVGVHHVEVPRTLAALEEMFGVSLSR